MEFLVEFTVTTPPGVAQSEIDERQSAEALAAAKDARDGHLVRLWTLPGEPGESRALGLYRIDSEAALRGVLEALPLWDWISVIVTPLGAHPNDPNRR
jgi:muconolactone delta-isomerase